MVYIERQVSGPIPPSQPNGSPLSPQKSAQGVGYKLFEAATEFYDWLMGTWLSTHADQAATYQRINQLLRVAECSSKSGHFLSSQNEDKALEYLQTCREQLCNGEIRTQEIPTAITNVLFSVTHNNPKALLVAKLTEVEYRYCIYPAQKGDPSADPDIQLLFKQVAEEIAPRLLDIKALELARELTSFLESDKPAAELRPILQNWLSSNLY